MPHLRLIVPELHPSSLLFEDINSSVTFPEKSGLNLGTCLVSSTVKTDAKRACFTSVVSSCHWLTILLTPLSSSSPTTFLAGCLLLFLLLALAINSSFFPPFDCHHHHFLHCVATCLCSFLFSSFGYNFHFLNEAFPPLTASLALLVNHPSIILAFFVPFLIWGIHFR